jgi:hypothetical protein
MLQVPANDWSKSLASYNKIKHLVSIEIPAFPTQETQFSTDKPPMKNLFLMALLLAGCSALNQSLNLKRSIASFKLQESVDFDLELSEKMVFANGANSVFLSVAISSDQKINPKELKLISDVPIKSGDFSAVDGKYIVKITPTVKSPNAKLVVIWNDQSSPVIELKTTLYPLTDKMLPHKTTGNTMMWVAGLTYMRQDYLPEAQFEGFSLDNRGKNVIVNAQESLRDFEFEFDEQARQNISLMVSDAPNGTVSHTMHSHFAFFPRKYLPFAEINSKKEVTVTLPTGEQMMFAESGEIIDGVFEEGPVDVSPDRFKRHYADLKYRGKGILLRANARGQMPQQGQFESTKIDMEYGIKYSADVLIINGSSGQRCRRPKIDFWPSEDVSPILFKFPTDKEFDTYLKAKCNFGIPDLEDIPLPQAEDSRSSTGELWKKCLNSPDIKRCLNQESSYIDNPSLKSKVEFDLEQKYIQEKRAEASQLPAKLSSEIHNIRTSLLSEATWVSKQSCLEKSQSLVRRKLSFHDIQVLLKSDLIKSCSTIMAEMDSIAGFEVKPFEEKIQSNFDWVTLTNKGQFISDCQKQAARLLTTQHKYFVTPEIYLKSFESLCIKVEASVAYGAWLNTQTAGLEERILIQVLNALEEQAEKRAISCVKEFPIDTQLNRIRLKKPRENCLVDNWESLEAQALNEAKKDPLVSRVNLNLDNVQSQLSSEGRRIQLKLMKKYFY